MKQYLFHSIIGSLMYAMLYTRLDLTYSTSSLSQFLLNLGTTHWKSLMVIMKYVQATKHLNICYGDNQSANILEGYTDADWAIDVDTRRSTFGLVFLFNQVPISWNSQKQTSVALSSTESEYITTMNATKETI
ncbi:hypothetical protein O6H91_20G020400 [Diphasiastrum complanatum]|uniref:Uncharacterized protein n=1 Tax=Diphasiastrum complanatum TaxID=34168 RepID=A0ACC2AQ15_DIPCM|nr:hypothetical protein O6H91_20G020400 [Diphasiastrum complanatum]